MRARLDFSAKLVTRLGRKFKLITQYTFPAPKKLCARLSKKAIDAIPTPRRVCLWDDEYVAECVSNRSLLKIRLMNCWNESGYKSAHALNTCAPHNHCACARLHNWICSQTHAIYRWGDIEPQALFGTTDSIYTAYIYSERWYATKIWSSFLRMFFSRGNHQWNASVECNIRGWLHFYTPPTLSSVAQKKMCRPI